MCSDIVSMYENMKQSIIIDFQLEEVKDFYDNQVRIVYNHVNAVKCDEHLKFISGVCSRVDKSLAPELLGRGGRREGR